MRTLNSPLVRYLRRRLLILVSSLFLATVTLFVLLRLIPGDPSNSLLSVGATPDQIKAARHAVGSDLPLTQQFFHWFNQLIHFNFGTSLISGVSVSGEVFSLLRVTVPLTCISFFLAILIALPVGFISAYRRQKWYGTLLNGLSQLGIAIPVFWVGIIFIYAFALHWMVFPAGGFPPDGWHSPLAAVRSLVLPVSTIAIVMASSLVRYVRSATLDVLGSDYLRTSRALGFKFSHAIVRHGLRNGAAPVISILGIELATTFVGAVVVESVFALPGLGSLLIKAIAEHDYPVIQGVLFLSTLGVLIIGFLADLLQRIIDPRLNRFTESRSG